MHRMKEEVRMIRLTGSFLGLMCVLGVARGDEPRTLSPEKFAAVHRMVKRQPGEWPWAELPWNIHFADAQRKALSEGKPIFVALAAQGSPVGCL